MRSVLMTSLRRRWRVFGSFVIRRCDCCRRSQVWSRSSATVGTDPVLLDIDTSLVEIHSENKEQTAPTFKGGFSFHPLFCFADATGETLATLLRPGNAGSNTVADSGVAQLPGEIA